MKTSFKTLKTLSGIFVFLGSMLLIISFISAGIIIFYLLSDATEYIEKLLAGINGFLIGGGIIIGVNLLVSGEFIKLMLSIEDNLYEQTYLLQRLVKNSLPKKNEPD